MAKRHSESETAPRRSTPAIDELPALSSTQVQNGFGGVLDALPTNGAIVIHRHDRPAAVLMSVGEFVQLRANAQVDRQLNMLTAEFDALVARMQTSAAAVGLSQAFGASPAALAAAAKSAIRGSLPKRGQRSTAAAGSAASAGAPAISAKRPGKTKRR